MKKLLLVLLVILAIQPVLSQEMLHFKRTKGPYMFYVNDLKFNKKNNIFLLGTYNNCHITNGPFSLLKSTDNGDSWIDLSDRIPFQIYKFDISISSNSHQITTDEKKETLYALSGGGDSLALSIDAGESWKLVKTGFHEEKITNFVITKTGTLFIVGYSIINSSIPSYYFYRSTNDFETFAKFRVGNNPDYISFFINTDDNEQFIRMLDNEQDKYYRLIYSSSDDGLTWNKSKDIFNYCNLFLGVSGYYFYFGSDGVHRSKDKGITWESFKKGLYPTSSFLEKSATSTSDGLFIITEAGISQSVDNGESWNEVYFESSSKVLITHNNANRLYYVNQNQMIFYSEIPVVSVKNEYEGNLHVYPNPAYRKIHMNCDIQQSGKVKCSIFNQIGNESGVLFDEYITQGSFNRAFNIEYLSPGMYFLKFEQGSSIIVKKIMVL